MAKYPTNDNIAINLRKIRKEHSLTQKELAEKVGISPQTYNTYEKRGSVPTLPVLEKIAKILGVSVDYLKDDHTDSEIYLTLAKQYKGVFSRYGYNLDVNCGGNVVSIDDGQHCITVDTDEMADLITAYQEAQLEGEKVADTLFRLHLAEYMLKNLK